MVVGEMILETEMLVMGGGPGGYTAAIRGADLGKDVVLVEERPVLGGVCLTEGCIPSKTLIHAVGLAANLDRARDAGLVLDSISFDVDRLRKHIRSVVASLSSGVEKLVENRDIELISGHARFLDENRVYVEGANTIIRFNQAVIATGSRINSLPRGLVGKKFQLPDKGNHGSGKIPGIWTSARALEVPEIPESLLVIGGGYIGLEIGQAYAGLGSRVTLVEFNEKLLPGADSDLVRVVVRECKKEFEAIYTGSRVTRIETGAHGFTVAFEIGGAEKTGPQEIEQTFSQVLAATGRHPNTGDIGLETLGIIPDSSGRIETDGQCRTSISNIFAIGDVTHGPSLAHKAAREGKVAAEVIAGQMSAFDNVTVPAVLFTRPEIAWTGLTEDGAKKENIPVSVGKFPLSSLGRARSIGKTKGFAKVIASLETGVILGMGIVGDHASELIAEGTLAIEMGACIEDLVVSIHPHPSFSEAIMEAAEMAAFGMPGKKKPYSGSPGSVHVRKRKME